MGSYVILCLDSLVIIGVSEGLLSGNWRTIFQNSSVLFSKIELGVMTVA